MIRKIINFTKALFFHIGAGFPKSSQELIDHRYSICLECENYDNTNKQCLECGCNINTKQIFLNKLAWLDQKCPINKW